MDFRGIPLSIDPAALALAALALWIAVQAHRAATRHRARVVSIKHSWTSNPNMFMDLDVVVRNTGLPIQELSVWLAFIRRGEDGRTMNTNIQLGKSSAVPFEHGAIGRFAVKFPVPVPDRERVVMQWLQCFAKQSPRETNPRIVIKSGKFEVVSIRLVPRLHRLCSWWNRFAFWVNSKFDRHGQFTDGQKFVRPGKWLPKIGLRAWPTLRHLGEDAERELETVPLDANQSQSA